MSYTPLYTLSAFKDSQRLDIIVKKKIKKKIEEYVADPIQNAKKLTNSSIGTYRWRVGNYRVVFDIDKDKIIILRIGHRREIYKGKG